MRRPLSFLLGTLLTVAGQAQISIGTLLPQDHFLLGESIPVSVRITNFSGQTLQLGRDNTWLDFTIESTSGYPVGRRQALDIQGGFDLENASIATKRVDLTPVFEPLKPGRYLLTTYVRIPQWNERPLKARTEFDVFTGTVRWEQPFGMPREPGDTRLPEVRRYALQQAMHLKNLRLYVRIATEDNTEIIKLLNIGPLLTFSETEQQIDSQSRLHLLYQYGARSFYYLVIAPNGDILVRQTHDYLEASRPRLWINPDGDLGVRGGVRRPSQDDFPPPTPFEPAPPESSGSATERPLPTDPTPVP